MYQTNKVIWSEGMLLNPQQFQQQERYLENQIKQHTCNYRPYYWGIVSYTVNENLLKMGKLALVSCKCIFHDGAFFSIPEQGPPPEPIEITNGQANLSVYLGIALPQPNVSQVNSDENHCPRYQTKQTEVYDIYSTGNNCTEVNIAMPQLKLLTENDDRNGYYCLALLKIKECRAITGILLDEEYIPTCIDFKASAALSQFHLELIAMLQNRGKLLAKQLADSTQSINVETTNYLLLALINACHPQLQHIAATPCHPEILYQCLLSLLGGLIAYTSEQRYFDTFPLYQHDNLQKTFVPLMSKLRNALSIVLDQQIIPLPLEKRQYGVSVAAINDKSLLGSSEFILGVSSDEKREKITVELPQKIKISGVEYIREIINRALPGIKIEALSNVPQNIPFSANTVYFILEKNNELWDELAYSSGLALYLEQDYTEYTLELWAIRNKK